MLNIDTLYRNKGVFNPNKDLQNNGVGIWDLTSGSMEFRNINMKIKRYFLVREEFQMRPDQLAFQAFGDLSYTGSLMKLNSISNPFALKEGNIFVIPIQERIDATFDQKAATVLKSNDTSNPNQQFRDIQEQKKFKISSSRQKFLEQRAKSKNPAAQILPPNFTQAGERQTVRTNVVIGLAPDVSNATPNPVGNLNSNPV
jgi:hypothetical protein